MNLSAPPVEALGLTSLMLLASCQVLANLDHDLEAPADVPDASTGLPALPIGPLGSDGGVDSSSRRDAQSVSEAGSDGATDAEESLPEAGAIPTGTSSAYASAVLADTPLAYWRLGEATGIVAHDLTGHGYEGTFAGDVQLGASGAIAGETDGAIAFTSASGSLLTADSFDFAGSSPYTYELWVNVTGAFNGTMSTTIFSKEKPGSLEGTLFSIAPQYPRVGFERWGTNGGQLTAGYGDDVGLPAGTSHVVITSAGDIPVLYIDGVEKDGFVMNGQPAVQANASVLTFRGFIGTLDEVAVYDHLLTQARALCHYRIGIGGSASCP